MNSLHEVLPSKNVWSEMPKNASLESPPSPASPSQLDFFHKLGYSTEQVQAVLRKFGHSLDTNGVLDELMKVGWDAEPPHQPPVKMNVPVSKGDVPPERPSVQVPVGPGLSQEESGPEEDDSFRPIVIDGSNVAMSHGNKEVFSCLGIQLAVNYFLERGHKVITVFVPSWRSEKPRPDVPISDQHILRELEKKKLLVFTPSKRVGGRRVVCHDDRYIVRLAVETDGVIVSNDLYRDLQKEKPEWKRFIEERLLMYSFVYNKFMPPDDPMGRHGPSLDELLNPGSKNSKSQKKQPCPYGKKCTFGIKCKYFHPERPKQSNQSLADGIRNRLSPPHSSLQPGQSLSLIEDMAHKFTLTSGSLQKEHHSGSPSHGKGSHGKKSCSKKEKKTKHGSLEQGLVTSGETHEQLDSGLGSIDPQPFDHHYGTSLYSRPQSAPCPCCSQVPSHHAPQHHGMARSDMNLNYGMPQYPSYGPYSGGAYSQPADFQHRVQRPPQQMYWSDPYGATNPRPMWGVPEDCQASPGNGKDQREGVRKALLAIFNSQLVDAAMNLHPQLLDAQRLAAEILKLQSQGL